MLTCIKDWGTGLGMFILILTFLPNEVVTSLSLARLDSWRINKTDVDSNTMSLHRVLNGSEAQSLTLKMLKECDG